MLFSETHQAWYAGDDRWYKVVGAGGAWYVQWYHGIPTDSMDSLSGRDFLHTYVTWQEANEAAGRAAQNWHENASVEGRNPT